MWWLNGKRRPARKAIKTTEVAGLIVIALVALVVAIAVIIYKTIIPTGGFR